MLTNCFLDYQTAKTWVLARSNQFDWKKNDRKTAAEGWAVKPRVRAARGGGVRGCEGGILLPRGGVWASPRNFLKPGCS